MTRRDCCRAKSRDEPAAARGDQRFDAIGWLVPATALALMPKCPMCVAAYVAVFTGIGVSLPVAAAVRTTLLVLAIVALALTMARTIARAVAR